MSDNWYNKGPRR